MEIGFGGIQDRFPLISNLKNGIMLRTKFHDIFQTRLPIIQAGMGPYDTTLLAGAVSKAGGIGIISTVGMGSFDISGLGQFHYSAIFGEGTPEERLERSINHVLAATEETPGARFGVNIPVSEEFVPTASRLIRYVIRRVKKDPAAKEKLKVIVTSAGDPLPWSKVPGPKELAESIAIKNEIPETVWVHVVPSVRAALRCIKAGVDVIVASGREGGAHCSWRDTSTMVLLPEVVKRVSPTPVVAAGGFADGVSLAAALAMGAIGVQMGTRFIATRESDFEQVWKEMVVKSTEEDALVARGFFGPMRFLRNRRALELVDATIRGTPDLYKGNPCGSTQELLELEIGGLANLFQGKIDEAAVLGGTVAGRVHDIPTVQELCDRIMEEAEAAIRNLESLIVQKE
jgi:NAD(P)H-dependent flavin oxidoreductase YrpB (nitropropane dioxygenase family)